MAKGDLVTLHGFKPEPAAKDRQQLDKLAELYRAGWLQPPSVRDALEKAGSNPARKDELYTFLVSTGILIKLNEDLYYHSDAYNEALKLLHSHFAAEKQLTLAQFRDITGSSRKYVQALLEHFDQLKLTKRVEDHRVAFKL